MNDQNTNQPIEPSLPPTPTPTVPQPIAKTRLVDKISAKIPPKVKEALKKFYENKKIFLPVSIAFGLLLLTLIIGILFGSRGEAPQTVEATPTPKSQETGTQESSASSETKLEQLKNQIEGLDIDQKRLQPPTVDFKIKF